MIFGWELNIIYPDQDMICLFIYSQFYEATEIIFWLNVSSVLCYLGIALISFMCDTSAFMRAVRCISAMSSKPSPPAWHIETQTIWATYDKRYIQMHSLLNWCNWQQASIGSDNGLAPNRRQVIVWTNHDLVLWCLYASLIPRKFVSVCWVWYEIYNSYNRCKTFHTRVPFDLWYICHMDAKKE